MKSKVQPYVLNVAEQIYSEIVKIKKTNDSFSNIQAIETFIGSEISNLLVVVSFMIDGLMS